MTERSEAQSSAGMSRILTLVGDLLHEMGTLIESREQPALPAESAAAPKPAPDVSSPPVVPGEPDAIAHPAGEAVPMSAEQALPRPLPSDDLVLVCEGPEGRIAFPWTWVVDTRFSAEGGPVALTVASGTQRRELGVRRVVGLWTRAELSRSDEPARWLNSAAELPADPPAERALGAVDARPESRFSIEECLAGEDGEGAARRVWIASPSALARRFLMRHLVDLGFEVHEARDLDDPLLPADLRGVSALFLDEGLLDDWRARSATSGPPLVRLTVEGALSVPPDGICPPQGAILPRPFERSEVERIVRWVCSLRPGARSGGIREHGDEEDDTWLFADPFGAARAGEHSRS